MSLETRLQRLEQENSHESGEGPVRILVLHLEGDERGCEAPPELSSEAHHAWHRARGDRLITLDPSSGSRRDDGDWQSPQSCPANRRRTA